MGLALLKRRHIALAVVVLGLLGAAWWAVRTPPAPAYERFDEWLIAIDRVETRAFVEARRWAAADWPRMVEHLPRLAEHSDPRVRALCCELLAERPTAALQALLLARASDRDWRVRSAAYRALKQLGGAVEPLPMRDTPLAQRERAVLAWLQRQAPVAPGELCEVYAADRHLQFGQTLAERCAACHARSATHTLTDGADCASCHGAIAQQWADSSHAQSLSHLRLNTVDPASRQPVAWSWGERRGIACGVCHEAKSVAAPPQPGACRYEFEAQKVACATCHAAAEAQWRRWLTGRQPRRASWPPGAIDLERRGDRQTCTDCHMPDTPAGRAHHLTARRDPALLAGGVSLSLSTERDRTTRQLLVTLTNLAGHDYPTGTRRRALRVYAGFDAAKGTMAAELVPGRLPELDHVEGRSAALSPGERRVIRLPIPESAKHATVRLVYVRNRLLGEAEGLVLVERRLPLTRSPRLEDEFGGSD